MNALAANWTPDPFATEFERREDGSLILRPLGKLGPTPPRLIDFLVHWAGAAPERVLVDGVEFFAQGKAAELEPELPGRLLRFKESLEVTQ